MKKIASAVTIITVLCTSVQLMAFQGSGPRLAYFSAAATECTGHYEGDDYQMSRTVWVKNTNHAAGMGKGPGIYYAGDLLQQWARRGRCQLRTMAGVLEPRQIHSVKLQVTDHATFDSVRARICFQSSTGTRYCGLEAKTSSPMTYSAKWITLTPPAGSFSNHYKVVVEFIVPTPAKKSGNSITGITTSKYSGIHNIKVYKK